MKEKCSNHLDRDALSFCHACKKYYCSECLVEGSDYYYCSNAQCQAKIGEELTKSVSAKKEHAEKTLSPQQRRLFTMLPGIAFWYSIFAPEGWDQRKQEAFRCQLIGSRFYLSIGLGLVLVMLFFSKTQVSPDELLLILFSTVMIG